VEKKRRVPLTTKGIKKNNFPHTLWVRDHNERGIHQKRKASYMTLKARNNQQKTRGKGEIRGSLQNKKGRWRWLYRKIPLEV